MLGGVIVSGLLVILPELLHLSDMNQGQPHMQRNGL